MFVSIGAYLAALAIVTVVGIIVFSLIDGHANEEGVVMVAAIIWTIIAVFSLSAMYLANYWWPAQPTQTIQIPARPSAAQVYELRVGPNGAVEVSGPVAEKGGR